MGGISGLMVCASYSLYYLSFICLVPLLYCFSNKEKINNYKILLATILFLIVWNAFNYQFLYSFNIDDVKVYIPVLIGVFSVLELLPFIVLLSNLKFKHIYFICLWILMEYFISQWFFKTPFSYLGILLANNASIIHWYNYTGVLGGSLWVIVVNVSITYGIVVSMRKGFISFRYLSIIIVVVFLPITLSLIISDTPMKTNEARRVKIHSYSSVCFIEQIQDSIIESSNDSLTKGVCYDVFPELVINLNNEIPEDNWIIESIIKNNLQFKKDSLITIIGANLSTWGKQQVLAVLINDDVVKTRYKDVLVPLGEEIPKMLDGIKNFDIYKNYLSETYITPDNNESIFVCNADSIHVSICYESFFEQNLKEKLKNEVGVLFVIAREPFINNYHYKNLTRLLSVCNAIIFNKYIVRSSWCGLSCIIDNRGYVLNEVYNKNDVLESVFYLNKKDTYYLTSRCNPILVFILLLLFFVIMLNFTSRFIS